MKDTTLKWSLFSSVDAHIPFTSCFFFYSKVTPGSFLFYWSQCGSLDRLDVCVDNPYKFGLLE